MKVAVAGATGFIGRALCAALKARGDAVHALSRDPAKAAQVGTRGFFWDGVVGPPPAEALAGVDAVVNLAGEGIAEKSWTSERRQILRDSRIEATRHLVTALREATPSPKSLVNGSAIGFYGVAEDREVDESSPPGSDFLARLVVDWESAAKEAVGLRVVLIRTGIVVGKGGGALAKMLLPFKLGLGGRLGRGTQSMSWIHLDDEVGLILHALDTPSVRGPVNAVAGVASNAEFTKALGRALRRPTLFPAPAFALRLMLGERADLLLLQGQRVKPASVGYRFRHPELGEALASVTR